MAGRKDIILHKPELIVGKAATDDSMSVLFYKVTEISLPRSKETRPTDAVFTPTAQLSPENTHLCQLSLSCWIRPSRNCVGLEFWVTEKFLIC